MKRGDDKSSKSFYYKIICISKDTPKSKKSYLYFRLTIFNEAATSIIMKCLARRSLESNQKQRRSEIFVAPSLLHIKVAKLAEFNIQSLDSRFLTPF